LLEGKIQQGTIVSNHDKNLPNINDDKDNLNCEIATLKAANHQLEEDKSNLNIKNTELQANLEVNSLATASLHRNIERMRIALLEQSEKHSLEVDLWKFQYEAEATRSFQLKQEKEDLQTKVDSHILVVDQHNQERTLLEGKLKEFETNGQLAIDEAMAKQQQTIYELKSDNEKMKLQLQAINTTTSQLGIIPQPELGDSGSEITETREERRRRKEERERQMIEQEEKWQKEQDERKRNREERKKQRELRQQDEDQVSRKVLNEVVY